MILARMASHVDLLENKYTGSRDLAGQVVCRTMLLGGTFFVVLVGSLPGLLHYSNAQVGELSCIFAHRHGPRRNASLFRTIVEQKCEECDPSCTVFANLWRFAHCLPNPFCQ